MDTNYSFMYIQTIPCKINWGNFKRAHTWQISHSAKDLPSHCTTKSEATDKAAMKLQPELGDYLSCWKRASKNCYSRELESGSTALNGRMSILCTPPRTKISEKMRTLQSAVFINKNIPKHGWVIQAVSFTLGKRVMRKGKVLVTTGVLPNAGSERCISCSAVTSGNTSLLEIKGEV